MAGDSLGLYNCKQVRHPLACGLPQVLVCVLQHLVLTARTLRLPSRLAVYLRDLRETHIWSRAPRPPPHPLPLKMVWEAAPPSVVWVGVDWESLSLLPCLCCGVWWVGSPSLVLPLWCGSLSLLPPPIMWWVGILLWCGVWWGRVCPSRVGYPGGREASLVRQTIFCGRRFWSETLGCPFKCFGRPWRFLLGTIQY